jgi:transposase-like protein
MEKTSKRGKIPQSDWPLIMARYDAGETLASIARTYDCSPPAISYVVSRSRARQPGAETPPTAPGATVPQTAQQLIKATASEPVVISNVQAPSASAPPGNGQPSNRPDEIWPREANGFTRNGSGERNNNPPDMAPRAALPTQPPPTSPASAGPANGDHRRTLHLSLGSMPQGNGATPPAEPHPAERRSFASEGQYAQPQIPQHQTTSEHVAPPTNPELPVNRATPERGRDSASGTGFSEARPAAYPGAVQRTDADLAHRREGAGSYIDKELRARVDGDIAAFLVAFDAALLEDTQESRSALREATDRLLRVGARTRIELERLEARMPLPPRDNIGRNEMAWRQR